MIILWIPASDFPTIPSSGSAFRLRSSLRLCPTVPPRLQLRRQLAPPTEPPTLLSCSYDRLAPMVRTFRPSSSAASSACTAERASNSAVLLDVKLASPAKLSGLIFDHTVSLRLRCISDSASRPSSSLRLRSVVPPHLPRRSSACAVSFAFGSAFLPASSACADLRAFQPCLLLRRSACALDRASGSAFLPGRFACALRPAFQPYLPT